MIHSFLKTFLFIKTLYIFSLISCLANHEIISKIVVTPNKTTTKLDKIRSSVILIDEDDINKSISSNVSQLLQEHSDFNIANKGSKGSDPSYFNRGLARKYIKVFIDGMDISDITSAQEEPTYIDFITINNIETVEILNGSQGTLYGSNAVGGVVSLNTKKAKKRGLQNDYYAEIGSFGTLKVGNAIKYLNENISLSSEIIGEKSHGFSSLTDDGQNILENDGYDLYSLNILINYKINEDLKLNLVSRHTYHGNEYDDIYSTPSDTDTHVRYDKQTSGLIGVTYRKNNSNHKLILQPSYSTRINRTSNTYEYDSQRKRIEYTFNKSFSESISFLAGSEYVKLDADIAGEIANKEVYSIYNEFRIRPIKKIGVDISSRREFDSYYENFDTFRLQSLVEFSKYLKIRSSVGTGYRSPGMYELFSKSYGNKNLEPEKSISLDSSIEYRVPKTYTNLSLNIFTNKVEDKIEFISNGYLNTTGETNIKGYSAKLDSFINDNTMLIVSYSKTNGKDSDGNRLKLVPKNKFITSIGYEFNKNLHLNLNSHYQNKALDTSYKELPFFKLLNSRLNYNIKDRTLLFLKLENLLNRKNENNRGYANPLRSFYLGVRQIL